MTRLPGLVASTSSSLTVTLTQSGIRTFSGSSASTLTFTLGSVAHAVQYTLIIPAGKFTTSNGLYFTGNWNIFPPSAGYTIDQTKDTIVAFETMVVGGQTMVWGNLYQVTAPDLTAPTVVSASATGTALTVVYSEVVITTSTGGLSLSYTTGTARTITGITSGSGTNTIVYSLSGAVSGSDVADFVVASSGVQVADGAGNPVAASSTGISFGSSMPQTSALQIWWSAPLQTTEGVAIATRVTDFSGKNNHGTATAVTLSSNLFQFGSADSTERYLASSVNCPAGTYTAISKVTANVATYNGYRGLWASTSGAVFFTGLTGGGSNDDHFVVRHANDTDVILTSYYANLSSTVHTVCTVFSGGTVTWYLDDMTTAVGSFSAGSPTASPLRWGQYDSFAPSHWQGTATSMAIWDGVALNSTERAQAASTM